MHIFVSHISEEALLAATLKEWIESTLLGNCEVFVSSDADSLPAGTRWLDRMSAALATANLMLVICSPASIGRPWVNFETGCAWAKGIPVIPVCHSGLTKGTLPRPLGEFQGLDASDPTFTAQLFSSIAKHLGIAKVPRPDATAMGREVAAAIAGAANATAVSMAGRAVPQPNQVTQQPKLASEAVAILKHLSSHTERLSAKQLAQIIKVDQQRTEYFIDQLNDAKLLKNSLVPGQGEFYQLSKEGRQYVFGSGAA